MKGGWAAVIYGCKSVDGLFLLHFQFAQSQFRIKSNADSAFSFSSVSWFYGEPVVAWVTVKHK